LFAFSARGRSFFLRARAIPRLLRPLFGRRALMAEITSGRHRRLGDAVLAAQQAYAEAGLMPELLSVYHLFGDPALVLR